VSLYSPAGSPLIIADLFVDSYVNTFLLFSSNFFSAFSIVTSVRSVVSSVASIFMIAPASSLSFVISHLLIVSFFASFFAAFPTSI
jgi:hypothetical protein